MVPRQCSVSLSPVPPWDAFREIVAGVPRLPAEEPVAKETPFQNIYLLAVEWILEIDPKTEHFGAN